MKTSTTKTETMLLNERLSEAYWDLVDASGFRLSGFANVNDAIDYCRSMGYRLRVLPRHGNAYWATTGDIKNVL